MRLNELLDLELLNAMLGQGYVNVRYHPDDPDYQILNYADKAAYEREWNLVTRLCRGLIVVRDEIIARPFSKFFNVQEPEADYISMDEHVHVDDKIDGSLGIVYIAPDSKPAVATRGSFASEQAIWATDFLRRQAPGWKPLPGVTYLAEIIYPANRIVLDYQGRNDLVLLDALETASHTPMLDDAWPFSIVKRYAYEPLVDALERPPRPNAEGYVLSTPDGRRVKVKQEDYLELHRIVTNLTKKRVWEYMRDNAYSYTGLAQTVPDEFAQMIEGWGKALWDEAEAIREASIEEWKQVQKIRKIGENRKYWAESIKDMTHPNLGFLLLDERDPAPVIWRMIEPKGE